MSKKNDALSLLFDQPGVKVLDLKLFKGDGATLTADHLWDGVMSALCQERSGSATISTSIVDPAEPVDAVAFLEQL